MARKLKYVGNGEFIEHVPMADHTCADNKLAEQLVAGGLYEYAVATGKRSKANSSRNNPAAGKHPAPEQPADAGTASDEENGG